jgi:hypothetical protein
MKNFKVLLILLAIIFIGIPFLNANSLQDNIEGGVIEEIATVQYENKVILPVDFNVNQAEIELKNARKSGNIERTNELLRQISKWWQLNHTITMEPCEQGSNPDPGPESNKEKNYLNEISSSRWYDDVRIDPNDGVFDVKIASLSNGDLYAIARWSEGDGHLIVYRSIDNGDSWSVYSDYNPPSGYSFSYPGILISSDTIIYWYIMKRESDNTYRTWVKACLQGPSETAIYWGSPTGGFNPVRYTDLHLATDVYSYEYEYLYATWCEQYGNIDSTRVMFARSDELDVSLWEGGPTLISRTIGDNIYYRGSKIAYGSSDLDMLWIVAYLHPNYYPQTYDRAIKGLYSTDYGSTWSSGYYITSLTNHLDETEPAIAGAHTNTNWVVLYTQKDTIGGDDDRDVRNCYSTNDGTNWTNDDWISNSNSFKPDVWVDSGSTHFFGTCRQNRTAPAEYVRYKVGNIDNPSSWINSIGINDNPASANLSENYVPSISYNEGTDEAIIAWTSYQGYVYSIWFDAELAPGHGIADKKTTIKTESMNLTPNPSRGKATLYYSLNNEGIVNVSLYDVSGKMVERLFNGTQKAGRHSINIENMTIAPGVYFVRMETSDNVETKTLTILK